MREVLKEARANVLKAIRLMMEEDDDSTVLEMLDAVYGEGDNAAVDRYRAALWPVMVQAVAVEAIHEVIGYCMNMLSNHLPKDYRLLYGLTIFYDDDMYMLCCNNGDYPDFVIRFASGQYSAERTENMRDELNTKLVAAVQKVLN